jgi:hypothetical protein
MAAMLTTADETCWTSGAKLSPGRRAWAPPGAKAKTSIVAAAARTAAPRGAGVGRAELGMGRMSFPVDAGAARGDAPIDDHINLDAGFDFRWESLWRGLGRRHLSAIRDGAAARMAP